MGAGMVGCVGYCWGGVLSVAAAMHEHNVASIEGSGPLSGAISYYGTGSVNFAKQTPNIPLQMHFGDQDASIPEADIATMRAAWPDAEIYVYEGHHGFNCTQRAQYNKEHADTANARALAFLSEHIDR
jgi:carboxymethylenebutenolidase